MHYKSLYIIVGCYKYQEKIYLLYFGYNYIHKL